MFVQANYGVRGTAHVKLLKSRATTCSAALCFGLFSFMFFSTCVFYYITFCVVSVMYPQWKSKQRCDLNRREGLCNYAALCSGAVQYDKYMIRTGKTEHENV
jgi:hypothetical protein